MQISLQRAEQIVEQYANALARQIPDNGIARFASWLPCQPEIIVQAIKLVCAMEIQSQSFSQDMRDVFGTAIGSLSSFASDEKAQRINSTRKWSSEEKFEQRNSYAFRELDTFRVAYGQGLNRRVDLENFIRQVERLDPNDPLYYQRAYTLAGAEYLATNRKRRFWQIFSGVA